MRIAITGSSGFVGNHLAERYEDRDVIRISRREGVDIIADIDALTQAFTGCDVVAHCAGINREIGQQTYQRVHIQGTHNVVEAAKHAGVKKILFMSFLRARPNCGSPYHESKWAAEELVRQSGLDYTVLKAGMTYGRGDHMLDHLSHVAQTIPFLPTVGFRTKLVRPLPVADLIDVLVAAANGELSRQSVSVLGKDKMTLAEAVQQVARNVDRRLIIFPIPIWTQQLLAYVWEATMKVPLASHAQIRILAEGLTEAAPWADALPATLTPQRGFTDASIQAGLPPRGPFGLHDLLLFGGSQPK